MLHSKFQGHRPFGSGEEDFLKVIYKGCFKSFVALYADRICSDQHFVENRTEKIPIRLEVIVISYLSIPFFLGE